MHGFENNNASMLKSRSLPSKTDHSLKTGKSNGQLSSKSTDVSSSTSTSMENRLMKNIFLNKYSFFDWDSRYQMFSCSLNKLAVNSLNSWTFYVLKVNLKIVHVFSCDF